MCKVLLDPSMTKTHSREVRELRKELEEAGTLKGMDRRSALLPLFEKTGRLKLPAVRYRVRRYLNDRYASNKMVVGFMV